MNIFNFAEQFIKSYLYLGAPVHEDSGVLVLGQLAQVQAVLHSRVHPLLKVSVPLFRF